MNAPPKPLPAPGNLPKEQCLSDGFFSPKQHSVPTLEELKVDSSLLGPCLYPGGESEALRRMEESLKNTVTQFKFSPNVN